MKYELAFVLIIGVVFVFAGTLHQEEFFDEDLDRALKEHRDIDEMDEEERHKRAIPDSVQDVMNSTCCQYIRSTGLCYKPMLKVCNRTCGCHDLLSTHSCYFLRKYKRCGVPVFRKYCGNTCKFCPHYKN